MTGRVVDYDQFRSTSITRAISSALRDEAADPYRLLVIAVVAMAVSDESAIDVIWCELADLDHRRLGVHVYEPD